MIYTFTLKDGGTPVKTIEVRIQSGSQEETVLQFLGHNGPMQKHQILTALNHLGSHDVHEEKRQRTSMRKLQQILRDLTEMGVPIVRHVKDGVWIATEMSEVHDYADWLERKAKADIASMMHMRKTLLVNCGIEKQSLFDRLGL